MEPNLPHAWPESLEALNQFLDPFLIIPYRWLADPVWAWWLGTWVLVVLCLSLGGLTARLGRRLNRQSLGQLETETKTMHDNSWQALRQGDKTAYKAMNKLANEAFGRSFFLRAAMGVSALWPAFLAAGWLDYRFHGLAVPLPGQDFGIRWQPAFLLLYLGTALAWWRLKRLAKKKNEAMPGQG